MAGNGKGKSIARRIVRGVVLLVVVVGLVAGYLWWRWSSVPAYWEDNRAFLESTDGAQLSRMAEVVEKRVPMDVSRIEVADTETVRLTFEDMNAWLAQRMNGWLNYRGWQLPPEVTQPMVAAEGDLLVFAVKYVGEGMDQVLSIVMDIGVEEDGRCRLRFVRARGGKLSLPAGKILDQLDLGSYSDQIVYESGSEPSLLFEPVFAIDPNRNTRLVDVEVDAEAVSLIVRNERKQR